MSSEKVTSSSRTDQYRTSNGRAYAETRFSAVAMVSDVSAHAFMRGQAQARARSGHSAAASQETSLPSDP